MSRKTHTRAHVLGILRKVRFASHRYELFIDDLPVWGFVGPPPEESTNEGKTYIYLHKSLAINYNGEHVRTCVALDSRLCSHLADLEMSCVHGPKSK